MCCVPYLLIEGMRDGVAWIEFSPISSFGFFVGLKEGLLFNYKDIAEVMTSLV